MKKWVRDGLKGVGIGLVSLTVIVVVGIAMHGFNLGHVGFGNAGGFFVGVTILVLVFGVPVSIFGFFLGVLIGSKKERRSGSGEA
jgi:hypothetical protein